MAEHSGFFDAYLVDGEYDRVYLAESFAKYFANFIGNGVFGGKSNELMVQQEDAADMSVRVLSGMGYINGYFYENDDEISLTIDNADGVLNRIDLIVLRWNKSERVIRLAVEKGTPATNPTAPSLKRNDDYYELELAQINVKAGTTRITQVDITDMRLDSSVCGLVIGVVEQLDTEEFALQLRVWMEEFKIQSTNEINTLLELLRELVEEGGFGTLINDVQKLNSLQIESEEYPGCYYRIVDGETEWINPPCEYGVEYRLTERFEGKPVYQIALYVAALPNNSFMNVSLNSVIANVISVEGVAYNESVYSATHPFPVYNEGAATPSAVIQNVGNSTIGNGVSIRTFGDMRAYKANIVIKYTKT